MTKRNFAVLIVAALLVGAPAGAYKPQCKDSSGRLIQCSGNLDNSQAPTAPAMSGANVTSNTIPAAAVVPGTVDNTEFGYLDGVTSSIQNQFTTLATSVAYATSGRTYYLQEVASDIVGYESLRTQPRSDPEDFDEVMVSAATSPVLIDAYATDDGVPNIVNWPAGNWITHIHASVDVSAGHNTRIVARYYSRSTLGVETLLFESTSPQIVVGTTEYQFNTVEPQFLTAQSDRLVVKFYATTTSVGTRTVRLYYQGATQTSYIATPIPSPLPISGDGNQVLATPDGAAGLVSLRSVVASDLSSSFILPATKGGTGQTSYTVGDLLYASTTTALSKLNMGTSGYLLTSNGAGVAPTMQAPITSTSVTGTAGASHSLTTNTYEAIPSLSVSLAAGTYLCSANVRSTVQCSAGTGYLTLKLYNVTAAADIANSERLGALCSTTGQAFTATTPINELVTVGTTSTIQVYAVSPAGATYTARDVLSDVDGRSRLACVKTAS